MQTTAFALLTHTPYHNYRTAARAALLRPTGDTALCRHFHGTYTTMKLRYALLSATLLLGVSAASLASAGGLFVGLPVAGGAASGTGPGDVATGNSGTANQATTIPAGPALPLTGNELIPADTQLPAGQQPQTEYVSAGALGSYTRNLAGVQTFANALIGGDMGVNPFQRGVSGGTITTASTFTADRWAMISGTSTTSQWSQQTGAGDIPANSKGALRIQRTSGQTGVVAVCVAQPLNSADSTRFAGHKAVFQFEAQVGANFSAASNNVTASIVYGTGSNQSTATLFAGTWTGQTNAVATVIPLTSAYVVAPATTPNVYYVAGNIPATATQVAVEICYTPVGTAGTNDWFEFTDAQLTVNDLGVPSAFEALPAEVVLSQALQYFWQLNETATSRPFLGQVLTTSTANIKIPFPVPMWKAPTPAYTAGGWSVGIAAGTVGANQICASLAAVASSTTQFASTALCTATSGIVAGNATELVGTLTTGVVSFSAEL